MSTLAGRAPDHRIVDRESITFEVAEQAEPARAEVVLTASVVPSA